MPPLQTILVKPPVEKSPVPAGPGVGFAVGYQSIRVALTFTPPPVTFAIDKLPKGVASAFIAKKLTLASQMADDGRLNFILFVPPRQNRP